MILASLVLAAFTVLQTGDQKVRREFTFENPGPDVVRAEACGCQHVVFRNAAGEPVKYYHTVTDSWCAADRMVPRRNFSPLAWSVVGGYFAFVALMGWHFGRRKKNAASFFRGGGRIPWYVAGMSLFATMLSSVTFLSVPALAYVSDWRLLQNSVVGYLAVTPLALFVYMPAFRRMKLTSAYEYLERRFNLGARLFASFMFVVFMVLKVAIVELLPALALDAVTGMGVDLAIGTCGIVTVLYCACGGLEAVIWSDFVQGLVLVAGAVAILVFLAFGTDGGFGGMVALGAAAGKWKCFDFRPEFGELTFWVAAALGITQLLFYFTADQSIVQRYVAVRNESEARRSIVFNSVLGVGASVVFFAIGTGLWTHYKCHPELLDPTMEKMDSILPHFMNMELPAAVAGLVIAAVFAATISTLSANLAAASSALATDFVVRFKPSLADRARVRWGQFFVVVCGIVGTAIAFLLAHTDLKSICDLFMEVIATVTAGLAGVFILGVFCRWVGGAAALTGLAANYLVCFALKFGGLSAAWGLHPFLNGGIGLVAGLVVALAVAPFCGRAKAVVCAQEGRACGE